MCVCEVFGCEVFRINSVQPEENVSAYQCYSSAPIDAGRSASRRTSSCGWFAVKQAELRS